MQTTATIDEDERARQFEDETVMGSSWAKSYSPTIGASYKVRANAALSQHLLTHRSPESLRQRTEKFQVLVSFDQGSGINTSSAKRLAYDQVHS